MPADGCESGAPLVVAKGRLMVSAILATAHIAVIPVTAAAAVALATVHALPASGILAALSP
jgi:hypothetical protein